MSPGDTAAHHVLIAACAPSARFRKIVRDFHRWEMHQDYRLAVLTTPGPRSNPYRYEHMTPKIEGNTLRGDLEPKWALHKN